MSQIIRWSHKTLTELVAFYNDEIAHELRRNGHDPHTPPSYQTLANLGYSGLDYTLREHHDLTLKQFLVEEVGLDDPTASGENDEYAWQITNERTREEFESYLRALDRRGKLAESTLNSKRTHLAKYARTYEDLHDTSDLLAPLSDAANQAEEIERVYRVIEVLDDELATDETKFSYVGTVSAWYDRLDRHGKATFNPLEGVTTDFGWERTDPDNQALSPVDIRAMNQVSETTADRLLLVALAAWGLRSGEVARLRINQFTGVESGDPHLEFDARKNGPGTVSLLYGLDAYRERRDELVEDCDDWNGYLFPSRQAESGHIDSDTVRNRFHRLAEAAGVRVAGDLPKPHMARRFWYTQYQDAFADVLDRLDVIADDQGSSSADVVHQNYLSEEKRRRARRPAMQEKLAKAFETGDNP